MIESLLALGFPLTYYMLVFGFLIGIGLTAVFLGTLSVVFIVFLLVVGVIRVMPMIELLGRLFEALFPGIQDTLRENLSESFPVTGKPVASPAIYCWHPHGLFSMSHYFHIGTTYTKWDLRTIKGTAIHWFWWIPFGRELLETSGFVPSHYKSMKKVLEGGDSLSVTLGGVREILYTVPGKMRLNIKNRRGIFKMAIETGRPLVPVLVYGENELYEIQQSKWVETLNRILVEYALFIPIPSIKSCINWIQMIQNPLEKKVETYIGEPVEAGDAREATEKDIQELREKYFEALRKLYKETKPSSYEKELEIV